MPLFGKKFSPLKCPPRKKLAFHSQKSITEFDKDQIKLKLGNEELVFSQGSWKPVKSGNADIYKENENLKQMLLKLREENNLLKMKIEILLDMLTEETIKMEQKKHEGDIESLS